jgi:hypothetical protein
MAGAETSGNPGAFEYYKLWEPRRDKQHRRVKSLVFQDSRFAFKYSSASLEALKIFAALLLVQQALRLGAGCLFGNCSALKYARINAARRRSSADGD